MDAAGMWACLPRDLLVEILRPLDRTAVFRCAAACKPWRRAIMRNASCLGPGPALLLGFFHTSSYVHHPMRRPHHAPGPFADVLTAAAVDWTNYAALFQTRSPAAPFFLPPAAAAAAGGDGGGIGEALYTRPLSSRDGLVLLGGRAAAADLCLCDAVTGSCRVIPAAAPEVSEAGASYVLVTGGDDSEVLILAVKHGEDIKAGMTYQIFSTASGAWGPVERSARLVEEEGMGPAYRNGEPKDVVVCRGSVVYWLGVVVVGGRSRRRRRAFAVDVRTRRAWATELPDKYVALDCRTWYCSLALAATSGGDGQLSLVVSLPSRQIEVWVLVGDGDGEWTLRRTIDVQDLLPEDEEISLGRVLWLRTFCPRSGCMLGDIDGHHLVIPVDEDIPRPVQTIIGSRVSCYPYEMDWSTYVSRMKYF
ncbi:unnamed protein product [Urochloa decumbens]|uniref:F-box domain-containing protein n=1 Tax=Urochloa decumbens TaxID=240449 RepID=A0ABC9D9T2_9POAL